MEYQTLNNGLKIPTIGFGVFRVPDKKECEESVYQAIKAGYRLLIRLPLIPMKML